MKKIQKKHIFYLARVPKIFRGQDAPDRKYPYQVALVEVYDGNKVRYFCGGSIISENWILTAAYCLER